MVHLPSSLAPIQLYGVWNLGIWQRGSVAVLITMTPLPLNFLTHGESHGPDAMAPCATFGPLEFEHPYTRE